VRMLRKMNDEGMKYGHCGAEDTSTNEVETAWRILPRMRVNEQMESAIESKNKLRISSMNMKKDHSLWEFSVECHEPLYNPQTIGLDTRLW